MKKGKVNNVAKLAPLSLPSAAVTSMRRHTMPSPLPSPSMSSLNRHLTPVAAPRPRASHAPVAVRANPVERDASAPSGVAVGVGGGVMLGPPLGEAGSMPMPAAVARRRSEAEQLNDPHRHLALSPLPDMTRVAHRRRIQVCCVERACPVVSACMC